MKTDVPLNYDKDVAWIPVEILTIPDDDHSEINSDTDSLEEDIPELLYNYSTDENDSTDELDI